MRIIEKKKINETPGLTSVDLNTDHEGLANEMFKIIKRNYPRAKLGEYKDMYYVEVSEQEIKDAFLKQFDFSRAEAKFGF